MAKLIKLTSGSCIKYNRLGTTWKVGGEGGRRGVFPGLASFARLRACGSGRGSEGIRRGSGRGSGGVREAVRRGVLCSPPGLCQLQAFPPPKMFQKWFKNVSKMFQKGFKHFHYLT